MYKFTGFTEKANRALNSAIEVAENLGHTYIGSEHLLMGLVREDNGAATTLLLSRGVTPQKVEELIKSTVLAAGEYMAAAPAIRSTDTLKAVDENGVVTGTVDRERTLRIQTPQIFNADLIKGALTKAVSDGLTLTDDCAAIEIMGVRTHTVPGDEDNIKLTTPRDMEFAEVILRSRGDYSADRTRL